MCGCRIGSVGWGAGLVPGAAVPPAVTARSPDTSPQGQPLLRLPAAGTNKVRHGKGSAGHRGGVRRVTSRCASTPGGPEHPAGIFSYLLLDSRM